MRAAVALRDIVREAQDLLLIGVVPLHRDLDEHPFLLPACMEDVRVQRSLVAVHVLHETPHATSERELLLLASALVDEHDPHAVVEEGQLAQAPGEDIVVKLDVSERLRVAEKVHLGAAALGLADHFQRCLPLAAPELHEIRLAVASNGEPEPLGECIHHRHADAMKPARDLVGVRIELTAGMQLGHHDLGRRARELVLFVDLGRNAAPVVDDADRIVGVDGDDDLVAEARERLVDGVVDDLEHHVVQSRAVGGVADVHARTLAHGVEPLEHLDARGVVALRQGFGFPRPSGRRVFAGAGRLRLILFAHRSARGP